MTGRSFAGKRWVGGTTLGSMVAILVLVSPSAAAAPVHTVHAPYVGATTFTNNSTPQSGSCASKHSRLVSPAAAHLKNGRVKEAIEACLTLVGGGGSRAAYISDSAGFLGPAFKAGPSGKHAVEYKWRLSWNASGPDYGSAYSYADIWLFGNLFDNTTGIWQNVTQWDHVVNWTMTRSCSPCAKSGIQNVTVAVNVTLTHGHQYLFYTGMSARVSTTDFAPVPSSIGGTARIDLYVGSGSSATKALSMKVI